MRDLWAELASKPLIWLVATLLAYLAADALARMSKRHPLANPVLLSVLLLAPLLALTQTRYETYFSGAQFIHFLLGPATVALAVPLFANLATLKRRALPMLAALVAGALTGALSAVALGALFGLPRDVLLALAPKSATAPVALGVAEVIGADPALTVVLVLTTGTIGAVLATPLMNLLGVRDWRARGFAVGVAAHGIGTARAFQCHPDAGAYAGIGMALAAIFNALAVPPLVAWLL